MKHFLRDEIIAQKFGNPNNTKYIQRLQQMLDMPAYSQKNFADTGMITTKKDFLSSYSTPPTLHKTCTDVIKYIGGHYIQMLSSGKYLLKYNEERGKNSKDLDKLEAIIFKTINNE